MPLKADADAILEHMQQLPSSLGMDGNRRFWPRWLFRSDHVENAAEILNSGRLLSRAAAEDGDLVRTDSGSPEYVGQLSSRHRNLVRLYLRPRTPTQYVNEGIRPRGRIEYGAHMPVPVYLLFATSLLAEEGVFFTKGRLAQGTEVGDSAEFLKSIAFGDVYHDGGVGRVGESGRRSTILNARHSEVVIEDELPLDELRHIVCRSEAERETLLNLLSPQARRQWIRKIQVAAGPSMALVDLNLPDPLAPSLSRRLRRTIRVREAILRRIGLEGRERGASGGAGRACGAGGRASALGRPDARAPLSRVQAVRGAWPAPRRGLARSLAGAAGLAVGGVAITSNHPGRVDSHLDDHQNTPPFGEPLSQG